MKKYDSCLNCTKRYVGCHNDWENYKKYKKELEKIKQNRKLDKLIFKRRNYTNG